MHILIINNRNEYGNIDHISLKKWREKIDLNKDRANDPKKLCNVTVCYGDHVKVNIK